MSGHDNDAAVVALRLDVATAAHLRLAIDRWMAECRRDAMSLPAGLLELRRLIGSTAGHSGPRSAEAVPVPHTATVPPLLLTYDHAAEVLATSRSTLKRMVRSGVLPVVKVAGSPRVRKADLDAYVARLVPTRHQASA